MHTSSIAHMSAALTTAPSAAGIDSEDQDSKPVVADVVARIVRAADPGTDPIVLASDVLRALEKELGRVEFGEMRHKVMLQWATERVRNSRHAARGAIIESKQATTSGDSQPSPKAGQDRNASVLLKMWRSWFDWPLAGTSLGQANRRDLLSEADRYRKVARSSTARGAWLAAIAEALPNDEATVSAALSESQVADLASRHGVIDQTEGA